jgi:ATP diphosphatase
VAGEFGDLLFAVVNLGRHLGLDPEAALRGTNAKFTRRFGYIEAELARQGRRPADSTLEEMETLWQAAKAAERG